MSPFANKPELWLTSHVRRVSFYEPASKIQAVVKGHLVRRRLRRDRENAAVDEAIRRLLQPPEHTVETLLVKLGLEDTLPYLPSATVCAEDYTYSLRRRDVLRGVCLTLRLTGRSKYIEEIEWADYHQRSRASAARYPTLPPHSPPPDSPPPPASLWKRFKQAIWG